MSSKIQLAMVAIAAGLAGRAGFDPASFKDRGEMRVALVKGANDMTDDQWAGLPAEAQDWFNAAADAVKAKKVPDEFPDYQAEEAPRSRNRASASEAAAPSGKATAVEDLKEGDRVAVTFTKRGSDKTVKGEVVEISKRKGELVVKDAEGEEHEIDFDKVTATEVFHGDAGKEQPAGDSKTLGVGAEVEFKNKRGKAFAGTVKELGKDYIVLDNGDDCDLDRIDGEIVVVKGAPAAEPEPQGRGRSSAAEKTDAPAGDEKPKRSSNPKGVSVGARIRDLMAADPDMTADAVGKVLDKDGIEYRPATLEMIHKDCVYLIGKLREEKRMK